MKGMDVVILAAAAGAVYLLLRQFGSAAPAPKYWAVEQGNTGYPAAAMTGSGGAEFVWI